MENALILLIEDETQMLRFLRITLKGHGYKLVEAVTGKEGLMQAAMRNPDVILLDLGLPDMDGLGVIQQLRGWSDVSIIVISAREQEEDKIRALDTGADDYLTKPFSAGELLARIRVALRHKLFVSQGQKEHTFTVYDLKVDLSTRQVFINDVEIHLTPIEYSLLAVLIKNAGKVVTHSQLLKEVWGINYANQTQYLRVYMAQLRRKLESDPARPKFLINEPAIGYRLKLND
ncbi:MAG: response regulator [Nitrospirae bacterium]|nr:response regulator [Nitrospirota bacterium]MBF0534503.1 response regulator [Nitrospirota bacterium]MBF0617129.1 response regulator [Nitrospirota bacterium]